MEPNSGVKGQKIFMDTTKPDQPNYYSYGKRSGELAIPKDSLYHALKAFYAMGVNEFRQRDRYYLFPVVTGIVASERGYFYNVSLPVSQGDTIQTRQGATDYEIKLLKQIDPKWFEYEGTK